MDIVISVSGIQSNSGYYLSRPLSHDYKADDVLWCLLCMGAKYHRLASPFSSPKLMHLNGSHI